MRLSVPEKSRPWTVGIGDIPDMCIILKYTCQQCAANKQKKHVVFPFPSSFVEGQRATDATTSRKYPPFICSSFVAGDFVTDQLLLDKKRRQILDQHSSRHLGIGMEQFLLKKPNNGMVIPTSGNKRNAPDPSSTPTTAARNSQSPSTSSSSNSGNLLCLSRPVSSSSPSSTGAMRPSILGARPSPASVSSGNSFASAMFMARSEEASSEFSPQQQQQQQRRAPSPTPPAQQRPFLQLGAPSPTPRFGAHTALSSTTSDNGNGLGGGNTLQGGLSGFGRFKSSFFGDSPSTASGPAEAQAAPSPAVEAASAATCDTANGEMRDLSANPGKAVSPHSMGGDGGEGVGGVSRESKTGDRASILGKKSRMGNNTASRPPDADNDIDNR